MNKFTKDIEGTIYFLASSVNQLINLAEKNGFYPKGELELLKEEQKALYKEIRDNGMDLRRAAIYFATLAEAFAIIEKHIDKVE